jgi:hypothetical protein
MKKSTKFKRQKSAAVSFLINAFGENEDKVSKYFNRFTKEEILKATGKDSLDSQEDLKELLTYCFEKTISIKMNFAHFLIDIKIDRDSRIFENRKFKYNSVWIEVTPNTKKLRKFWNLSDYRATVIAELGYITQIQNSLGLIFEDDQKHPSIYSCPEFNMTSKEISMIR